MAVKTLYFKDVVPTGATLHRSLQDGGSAPTAATTGTGWVAATNAIGQACLQQGGSKVTRNDASWGTTLQPSAAPTQTTGDSWRSELPLDGTFANTSWTFAFGVRSVTAAYTGRFKLAVRVWRSSNPNGTGAVEITSGRQASAATSASLTTTSDTAVSVTWSPGSAFNLRGEYLFVNVGIEVTSAGGGTTQDVVFRVGSTDTITTSNFTPTPIAPNLASTVASIVAIPLLGLGATLLQPELPPILAQAPFVNSQTLAPDSSRAQQVQPDGSRSSRAIYDDASPPFVNGPTLLLDGRPIWSPELESRGSRAIYDVAASTDLTRGPLYASKREFVPQLDVGDPQEGVQPIGLRDVVVVAPFVAPVSPVPQPAPRINPDTTQDTPKTLTADGQQPVGSQQVAGTVARRDIGADTTSDTPLGLLSGLPPGGRSHARPIDRPPTNADTSAKTPKTLTADAQVPVGETPQIFAPDRIRPVVDTGRGTPKALLADAQLPIGEAAQGSAPDRVRSSPDTSSGAPYGLIAAVQAPFANPQSFAPDRIRSANPDASRGSAKTLTSDAQAPVGENGQVFAPDRVRPVVDTTLGTPKTLTADAQEPIGAQQTSSPVEVRRALQEGSKGNTPTDVLPAGASSAIASPQYRWTVADSSTSAAPVLAVVVAPAPIANAPPATPILRRDLGVDTSAGTPKGLIAEAAPVGRASFEPVHWPLRIGTETTVSTSPVAAQNVQPVTPPPPPVQGAGALRPFAAKYSSIASREHRVFDSVGRGSVNGRSTFTVGRGAASVGQVVAKGKTAADRGVDFGSSGTVDVDGSTAVSTGRSALAKGRAKLRGASATHGSQQIASAGRLGVEGRASESRGASLRSDGKARLVGVSASSRTLSFASRGTMRLRGSGKAIVIDAARIAHIDAHDLDLIAILANR